MNPPSLRSVLLRVIGTFVLVGLFVVFLARAPFVADQFGGTAEPGEAAVPVALDLVATTGALNSAGLPAAGSVDPRVGLLPSLGLFEASFAAAEGQPGFQTSEEPVPGACKDAGVRYFKRVCPACQLLGGGSDSDGDMLLWRVGSDGDPSVRAVSRHCTSATPEGVPLVGTVTFGADTVRLDAANGTAGLTAGRVPLLAGASRVASISLGNWSATYDEVARPSTALPDMAALLQRLGWREVLDPAVLQQPAFQGHRVFTNNNNAVCMISLQKQGASYQLLTIINLYA